MHPTSRKNKLELRYEMRIRVFFLNKSIFGLNFIAKRFSHRGKKSVIKFKL